MNGRRAGGQCFSLNVDTVAMFDRTQCIEGWQCLFGHKPPRFTSVSLMRQILAYETQVKTSGGLSKDVQRALKAALGYAGQGGSNQVKNGLPPACLRPGVHLVREWNGRAYQVEVIENGFMLDGRRYRSLSAIARKITGAHWSGPRFFGLADR